MENIPNKASAPPVEDRSHEQLRDDNNIPVPIATRASPHSIHVVNDDCAVEPLTDAVPVDIRRDHGPGRNEEAKTVSGACNFVYKRLLALPFVCINMMYNLRLELLIIWAVYEIARATCLSGNTRSAYDRGMAAADADQADLQCTDEESAAEDFEMYGLICIFIILVFFGMQWIFFLCRVWLYPYGSIGYVNEYVRARRSISHKALVSTMLIIIMCMVIYGFIVASNEGAPISMVASPLLEGLYTCVVACYELFDSQIYVMRARSEEVKMLILPIPHAFTDIMTLYYELEVALLAAKLEPPQLSGLELLGFEETAIALLLNDGLEMVYDKRMTYWREGKYAKAILSCRE